MKQISDPMNTPKLPTDTPNDHDASKEDQFDLLDPGEDMMDSGEEFKDILNDFQVSLDNQENGDFVTAHGNEEKFDFCLFDPSDKISDKVVKNNAVHLSIDKHVEHVRESDVHSLLLAMFNSVTFAKGTCNKISADRLMPLADTSMLWKPRDQELDDETPELQKDTITKFLPRESKVWKPGEHIIHQNPVESQDIRWLKMHIDTVLNKNDARDKLCLQATKWTCNICNCIIQDLQDHQILGIYIVKFVRECVHVET
jgi:hypothetical protein